MFSNMFFSKFFLHIPFESAERSSYRNAQYNPQCQNKKKMIQRAQYMSTEQIRLIFFLFQTSQLTTLQFGGQIIKSVVGIPTILGTLGRQLYNYNYKYYSLFPFINPAQLNISDLVTLKHNTSRTWRQSYTAN